MAFPAADNKPTPQPDPDQLQAGYKSFGERILNSKHWVYFRVDNKGSYYNFSSPDALLLIARYFSDPHNTEYRKTLVHLLKVPNPIQMPLRLEPEKDNAQIFGERIMTSPMWCVFRQENKKQFVHHSTPDAYQLIVNFFNTKEHEGHKRGLLQLIFEKTKFQL